MKKSVLSLLLIYVLVTLPGLAQVSDDTGEFKNYFQTYLKAYSENPAATLKAGAAPDYQMLGGDGVWRDLATTCQIFEGASKTQARVEKETYRVYGNTGVVTGTTFWMVERPSSSKYTGKALFTYVFAKTPGGWKQVSGQHFDLK